LNVGIAGLVAITGKDLNIEDTYSLLSVHLERGFSRV